MWLKVRGAVEAASLWEVVPGQLLPQVCARVGAVLLLGEGRCNNRFPQTEVWSNSKVGERL